MITVTTEILDDMQLQILNNPDRIGFHYQRIIPVAEFMSILEQRFPGRSMEISLNSKSINTGTFFQRVEWFFDNNMIEFLDLDNETTIPFKINLEDVEEIEFTDTWLDTRYEKFDMGGVFDIALFDGFEIQITVEK